MSDKSTALERAIQKFRQGCLPETNKDRMKKIENCLKIVHTYPRDREPTPEETRAYQKACDILRTAGVC